MPAPRGTLLDRREPRHERALPGPRLEIQAREGELARRIADKRRDIALRVAALRRTARTATAVTVAALAGTALMLGAWVAWRGLARLSRRS